MLKKTIFAVLTSVCLGLAVAASAQTSPPPNEKQQVLSWSALQQWSRRSIQHFSWPQSFKFFLNAASGLLACELRGTKLAR